MSSNLPLLPSQVKIMDFFSQIIIKRKILASSSIEFLTFNTENSPLVPAQ